MCLDASALRIPELVIELKGGVQLAASAENLFYEDGEGRKCMTIREMNLTDDGSIIGSRLQRSYSWEFDLHQQRVGFAPLDFRRQACKPCGFPHTSGVLNMRHGMDSGVGSTYVDVYGD